MNLFLSVCAQAVNELNNLTASSLRCSLTWWERSGRGKWRTAKRKTARRKVKVWPRGFENAAVFYSGKRERGELLLYIYISQTFDIYFVLVPDRDSPFLANRKSDHVSGGSEVALHTPFIALTFYVLTLQITYVLCLLLWPFNGV